MVNLTPTGRLFIDCGFYAEINSKVVVVIKSGPIPRRKLRNCENISVHIKRVVFKCIAVFDNLKYTLSNCTVTLYSFIANE